jgi:hypothetical protein
MLDQDRTVGCFIWSGAGFLNTNLQNWTSVLSDLFPWWYSCWRNLLFIITHIGSPHSGFRN